MPVDHLAHSVERQAGDPQSILARTRAFLHWRREQPALLTGDIQFLEAETPLLAMTRETAEQHLLCLFNLGATPTSFEMQEPLEAMADSGFPAEMNEGRIALPGYGAFFGRLNR